MNAKTAKLYAVILFAAFMIAWGSVAGGAYGRYQLVAFVNGTGLILNTQTGETTACLYVNRQAPVCSPVTKREE